MSLNLSLKNKIFYLFIFVIIISVTLVGWYGFSTSSKAYIDSAYDSSKQETSSVNYEIEGILSMVPGDLLFSTQHHALKKFMIWDRMNEKRKTKEWKGVYVDALLSFMEKKEFYYKARVIDINGDEIISAQYDKDSKRAFLQENEKLQNKINKDYVEVTKKLAKGKFYVSQINLNVENGLIETPYIAVIRYSTPIIDSNNELLGVFVLNVYADFILDILENLTKKRQKDGMSYFLVDNNGDYVYNKKADKRWNTQLKHGFTFTKEHFSIKDKFQGKESGAFTYDDKIYSFHKVHSLKTRETKNYWYAVSVVDTSAALKDLEKFKIIFMLILLFTLFSSFFVIRYYIDKITTPLSQVTNQLIALSKGEIKKEHIVYETDDEIKQIVDSTSILVNAIESTIIQTNAVANGDFTKDIALLGENDKLGIAIGDMTSRLKEITALSIKLSNGDYDVRIVAKSGDDKLGLALLEMVEYLKVISNVTESIALGNLEVKYKAKGEDDRLGLAVLEMIKYLRTILKQANAISKEDFNNSIKAKSKDDELGLALITMTDMLRESSIQNKNEIFFSEGVGQLSDKIVGITDTNELAKVVITDICRYLKASSGVAYLYDKEQKELNLIASFSFVSRDNLSNKFKLGEGVVGQVGLEKEPILLKNIKDDTFEVQSGTTLSKAKEVYVFPIIYEGELFGVGEILSFDEFSKIEQDYLTKISIMFANALYSVSQNAKIKELLEKSQQAFEELQVQSEELQESNVQMEEQQQQLNTQTNQLKENNFNLTKAKKEVVQRAKDLEEASRYKSEFLSNMSHELRTPLNSIILLSKLLGQNQDKTLSKTDVEKSAVINRAGNDLLLLINDILDLTKIESGNMELLNDRVYSGDILEEQKGLFSAMAVEKGIDFIINDNFKSEFTIDKAKLSQVLKNLLSNAFKFTKKGSVTIDMNSDKETLVFKIIDTGIGIPADKLNTIFEAFKQVDGSISREYGGTGLGLSISKTIVELFKGKIELESELGVGTTFIVILPLTQDGSTILKQKEILHTPKQENSSSQNSSIILEEEDMSFDENELKNKNILIVDDDSRNIFTLTSVLESMGAEVYSAFNGKEAIDMLKNGDKIDLILMDIMMPTMDGLKAIKEIKNDKKFKNIPIIAVTAKIMPEDKQTCLKAGANDYLPKPIKPNRLVSMLKAWL